MNLGKVAYKAYCSERGKTPKWKHLSPRAREAWEAAAKVVEVKTREKTLRMVNEIRENDCE
jgi:hypothetical protein